MTATATEVTLRAETARLRQAVKAYRRDGLDWGYREYPLVALTGYSRQGKDEAGKALIDLGYTRRAFGDIIKSQVAGARYKDSRDFLRWSASIHDPERHHAVCTSMYAFKSGIDPFSEVDSEKAILRPLLEEWGMWRYDAILAELFRSITLPCVNTRLMRAREAKAWREAGGIVVEIIRDGKPATEFEERTMAEMRGANLIDFALYNRGTVGELHERVRRVIGGQG